MRTTVEISSDVRAGVMALAARQGRKGFSHIVEEALRLYLRSAPRTADRRRGADRLMGSLSGTEGDDLKAATEKIRSFWR